MCLYINYKEKILFAYHRNLKVLSLFSYLNLGKNETLVLFSIYPHLLILHSILDWLNEKSQKERNKHFVFQKDNLKMEGE